MKAKYFKKGNHDMSRNSERDKFIELLNKKRYFPDFQIFQSFSLMTLMRWKKKRVFLVMD